MDLNRVYKMLEINSCGVTDVKELAEESGLTQHIVTAVLDGQKYRAVVEEFKADKAELKTRVYPVPKEKPISSSEYPELRERYLNKLISGTKTLDEIHSYLIVDDIKQSHVEKLMNDLAKSLELHKQIELETTLDRIDEILNRPKKWTIVKNDLLEVKPVPILEGLTVVGMEYRESGSFTMPDELFKVYVSYAYQVNKFLRGDSDHDLNFVERANVSLAAQFRKLKKQGYTNTQIADLYEIKPPKVTIILGYLKGTLSHLDDVVRGERLQRELLQELGSKMGQNAVKCTPIIEHNAADMPKVINSEYAEYLEQAEKMYELNIKGSSLGELSKEFAVSPTTVFKRLALYKRYLAEQAEQQ